MKRCLPVALCVAAAWSPPVAALRLPGGPPPPILTHSHNDYEQHRPLFDALKNHLTSVEADIWMGWSHVVVSHSGIFVSGRLKELYLDPLQKLVSEKGSVYGDGKTFYLWLDIKDGATRLRSKLEELLSRYPMFSVFGPLGVIKRGPVVAVLTGDSSKDIYMAEFPIRRACRDSNGFDMDDPQAYNGWLWYALDWHDYFDWDGHGPMPQAQQQKLRQLVQEIHEKGRKLRFWDSPDTTQFWHQAIMAHVDMIGTDHLSRVAEFIHNLISHR